MIDRNVDASLLIQFLWFAGELGLTSPAIIHARIFEKGKHVFATPKKSVQLVNLFFWHNSVANLEVSGGGFEMFNATGDSTGGDVTGLEMKDAATLPRPETSEFQHLHSFL